MNDKKRKIMFAEMRTVLTMLLAWADTMDRILVDMDITCRVFPDEIQQCEEAMDFARDTIMSFREKITEEFEKNGR